MGAVSPHLHSCAKNCCSTSQTRGGAEPRPHWNLIGDNKAVTVIKDDFVYGDTDTSPLPVWLSTLPIVVGYSLAVVTEASFNFQGLWGAVLQVIYSKKSLQSFNQVNGLNLYGCISIVSFMYSFPVVVFVEGPQWATGYFELVGKPSTFYL
ncbi:hypothetical protein ACLOJK_038790 [Asimina triloba]